MHILSLVFELGVMGVSLLNLLSEQANPNVANKDMGQQLSIMLVSIATTLCTFLLTLAGAGSSLAGLKAVAARVSGPGARSAGGRRSAGGSHPGRVAPTEALDAAVDAAPGVMQHGVNRTSWHRTAQRNTMACTSACYTHRVV